MREFLTWLWDHLMDLLPFVLVSEWERGVLVRMGKIKGELGTGLHWRIPFVDSVQIEPCTEQPIDLPVCNITTKDGRSISLSGNITYRIVSPSMLWQRVTDFDTSLEKLATGLLAQYASRYTWDALQHKRPQIQASLRKRLTTHLKDWGVEVVRVHLTDFVPAKQYNVFGGFA